MICYDVCNETLIGIPLKLKYIQLCGCSCVYTYVCMHMQLSKRPQSFATIATVVNLPPLGHQPVYIPSPGNKVRVAVAT